MNERTEQYERERDEAEAERLAVEANALAERDGLLGEMGDLGAENDRLRSVLREAVALMRGGTSPSCGCGFCTAYRAITDVLEHNHD